MPTSDSLGDPSNNNNCVQHNYMPPLSYTATSFIEHTESFRDERGLLKGIDYVFDELGKVNWRAMLKAEHLVIKKDKVAKYGKNPDFSTVDEKDLLILLSGIKYVSQLRGYTEVKPNVVYVSDIRTVVQTDITWIGNYETDFNMVTFGDVGAASPQNTDGFARNFLEAIAANRGFVRAVRNFLGINIVASDEMSEAGSKVNEPITAAGPSVIDLHGLLRAKVEAPRPDPNAPKESFDTFKAACVKKYKEFLKSEPEKWQTYGDIPVSDVYTMLGFIADKEEKSKK